MGCLQRYPSSSHGVRCRGRVHRTGTLQSSTKVIRAGSAAVAAFLCRSHVDDGTRGVAGPNLFLRWCGAEPEANVSRVPAAAADSPAAAWRPVLSLVA